MRNQLARGVVWLGASKVAVNVLATISTLLLAKLLTPEDFGLVAIGFTLLTIIGTITELSLGSALVQQTELVDEHFHTAWTLNFLRALLVGGVLSASAPLVVYVYADERLLPIMLWLGLSVAIGGLNSPKSVVFTRRLEFWQEFVQSVAQKLAGFVVCLAVAYLFKSYWALVAGALATQLAAVAVSYLVAPYWPRFSLSKSRELMGFAVWLSLGQLVSVLNWKLDHLLVGSRLGKAALGFYSVGDNLAGMPTRELIGPIERTLFPGFVAIMGDKARLQNAYRAAQTLVCSLALPAGVGCACIARPLVLLAMGERWLPIVQIMEFVAVTVAFQTISSAAHPLAMAGGQTKMLFKRDLVSFCIRVPLIVVGLYSGGLIGLLWARAMSAVIIIVMNMYIVHTMIDLSFWVQLRANLRAFTSVAVMAAGLLLLKGALMQTSFASHLLMLVGVLVAAGAAIYTVVHGALWLVQGKPIGPETEILRMVGKVTARIRGRLKVAA
jgi:lipopolysaccharide exporter